MMIKSVVSLTFLILVLWTPDLLAAPWLSLKFPEPKELGAPATSSGGGTRGGSCLAQGSQLIAIAPREDSLTIVSTPKLFVFVPATAIKTGQLILVDENGNAIYNSTVPPTGSASILELSLPSSVTLIPDQNYTWQFSLDCGNATDFVEARIKRMAIAPALKTQIEQAKTPLDLAQVYADQSLWQDTLMLMATLQKEHPQEWQELLTSVGLEAVTAYPIQAVTLE